MLWHCLIALLFYIINLAETPKAHSQLAFAELCFLQMKIPTGTCKVSVQGTTPGGGDQQDSLLLAVRVSGADACCDCH